MKRMLDWLHPVALLVATSMLGCGTIVELPVDEPSTETSEGTSGGSTADEADTTSPSSPSGTTAHDSDVDEPSTSGDPQGTTSSVDEPMSIPICGTPSVEIPEDGTWVEAPIEVPAQAGVLDLDVAVRIQHPHLSHLRVQLRAPDGTLVSLLDTPSCEGANLDALFDDDAGRSAEDACDGRGGSIIAGAVEPLDPLGPLLASPVEGTWALEVTDAAPEHTGSLDQVCLVLTVGAR